MAKKYNWSLDPEATGGAMAFIQWKGTDVCMDIWCLNCGLQGHFDEDFLYEWTCGRCGQLHEMSSFVRYRAIGQGEGMMTEPPVLANDEADWEPAPAVAPALQDGLDLSGLLASHPTKDRGGLGAAPPPPIPHPDGAGDEVGGLDPQ